MRRHRVSLLLAVPVSLVLAVSGCTGDAEGGAAPPATSGGDSTHGLSFQERAARYAQCMRENGVKMDDPVVDADGGITFRTDDGSNADSARHRAATATCEPLLGGGDDDAKPADPADIEALRQWAKCLRENGVPDYPDPKSDGSTGQKALDPGDPTVKAAMTACDKVRSSPGGSR